MWNPKPGSPEFAGSTCSVRCINPATGAPYPLDASGRSTCEYCKCDCTAAYEASAAMDIVICRMNDNDGGKAKNARVSEAKDSAETIVRTMENAGRRAFQSAARIVQKKQHHNVILHY